MMSPVTRPVSPVVVVAVIKSRLIISIWLWVFIVSSFLTRSRSVPCISRPPMMSPVTRSVGPVVVVADPIVFVPVLGLPRAVWWLFIFTLFSGHAGPAFHTALAPLGLPGALALRVAAASGVRPVITWLEGNITDVAAVVKRSVSIRAYSGGWPVLITDSVTFALILITNLFVPCTGIEPWLRLELSSHNIFPSLQYGGGW